MQHSSIARLMTIFIPTATDLANAWFVTCLLLGVGVVLALTWLICDYLLDWVIARTSRRRQTTVIDLAERRRLNAVVGGRSWSATSRRGQ